jgi:hypothetical protein
MWAGAGDAGGCAGDVGACPFFTLLTLADPARGVCRAPAESTHGNICPLPCVFSCSARQRDVHLYFLYSYKWKFQILANAVFCECGIQN